MKSKILAAIPDPYDTLNSIFIAESAGFARRVSLEVCTVLATIQTKQSTNTATKSSEVKTTYRGPMAPVTCVAIGGKGNKTIFAGSWDKDIWSWDIETAEPRLIYSGHSDFVKTVISATLSGKPILISGGADKKILVWDIETGKRLFTLQDASTTMLAVQHLAIDPVSSNADSIVVVSASSDPSLRRWKISLDSAEQITESFKDQPDTERLTILEHDTSVYKLNFDLFDDDVDLWTASADGTAKCLSRATNFTTADTLQHGDYVRGVVTTDQWIVTAGRDEDVKVWNRATGKLYCKLYGHFDEITDLVLLQNSQGAGVKVCSVGIDGTIRVWPLAKNGLDETVRAIEEEEKGQKEEVVEEDKGEGMLTAEEEAELAELMDD